MFEPVHGSAPKYAGKNVANPIGAILSAALMLDYLGLKLEAAAIEGAVKTSVVDGRGTAEIGGSLGTRETGDCIAQLIAQQAPARDSGFEAPHPAPAPGTQHQTPSTRNHPSPPTRNPEP